MEQIHSALQFEQFLLCERLGETERKRDGVEKKETYILTNMLSYLLVLLQMVGGGGWYYRWGHCCYCIHSGILAWLRCESWTFYFVHNTNYKLNKMFALRCSAVRIKLNTAALASTLWIVKDFTCSGLYNHAQLNCLCLPVWLSDTNTFTLLVLLCLCVDVFFFAFFFCHLFIEMRMKRTTVSCN